MPRAQCNAFPDNKVKNRPCDLLFAEGDKSCFVTRFYDSATLIKQTGLGG